MCSPENDELLIKI